MARTVKLTLTEKEFEDVAIAISHMHRKYVDKNDGQKVADRFSKLNQKIWKQRKKNETTNTGSN